jgi:hypothetical protein
LKKGKKAIQTENNHKIKRNIFKKFVVFLYKNIIENRLNGPSSKTCKKRREKRKDNPKDKRFVKKF